MGHSASGSNRHETQQGPSGFEPVLKPRATVPQDDPRVSYLQSGVLADAWENLPGEFIELAVQKSKIFIVNDDLY